MSLVIRSLLGQGFDDCHAIMMWLRVPVTHDWGSIFQACFDLFFFTV